MLSQMSSFARDQRHQERPGVRGRGRRTGAVRGRCTSGAAAPPSQLWLPICTRALANTSPLYWSLRSTVTRFYLHFANMEMSFLLYINVFEDDWWDREDINKAINGFIWDSFDWDQAAWALLLTKLVASSCALRLRSPHSFFRVEFFFICVCVEYLVRTHIFFIFLPHCPFCFLCYVLINSMTHEMFFVFHNV